MLEVHEKWQEWSLGNNTCQNIQRQSNIHTQTQIVHTVHAQICVRTEYTDSVWGGIKCIVWHWSLIHSNNWERKTEQLSSLSPSNTCMFTQTARSLLPPTLLRKQRSLCKGQGKPIFLSHACHSLWPALSLHMQVITISSPEPHDQQTECWLSGQNQMYNETVWNWILIN